MSSLKVHILQSLNELQGLKLEWNDLWARSSTCRPMARAEFLIKWISDFASDAKVRFIIAEEDDALVAALPLIEKRWLNLFKVGSLPRTDWHSAGDLLVDEQRDTGRTLAAIAEVLNKLPWAIYRLPLIPSFERGWQQFDAALANAGTPTLQRHCYDVTYFQIDNDWANYERSLSKNHRKKLVQAHRRMEQKGGIRMHRFAPRSRREAEPLMMKAFEIENSGWKGKAGTSILQTPGMQQLFETFGGYLAECGELELAFLDIGDESVAFEYMWNSKGRLTSCKVGYDERFQQLMPGHVLFHEILRDLYETQRCDVYDCFGPISPAIEKWGGARYSVNQWTIGTRRPTGRAVMLGYRQWLDATSPAVELPVCREPANSGTQYEFVSC